MERIKTGPKPGPILPRFEAKFIPEPNSGCWLWIGSTKANGYGSFMMYRKGDIWPAHRAAWRLYHGTIPDGLFVLHHCDNPSCVNPNHLFLGTHTDNMRDMHKKGRGDDRRGERSANRKLCESDITAIRASNKTLSELAAIYNIHRQHVFMIRKRKAWSHI